MAVVSVEELAQGEGSVDRLYQRYYTRNFQVLCDELTDGPAVIRASNDGANPPFFDVPQIGQAYSVSAGEADGDSFVERVVCTRAEKTSADGCYWHVRVDYGPYDATTYPSADPTEWPLEVTWDQVEYDEPVYQDINGDPIVNSAGQPFDPPLTITRSRTVLRIVRSEATYNPALAYQFSNKINTDSFLGADPYTVKCGALPGVIRKNPAGGYYAAITYTFEYDPNKWKKMPLDAGFCELDASVPPKLKKILDAKGQDLSEPALLDGSGHLMPNGGTPTFLEFDVYEEIDFATAFGFDFSSVPGLGTF